MSVEFDVVMVPPDGNNTYDDCMACPAGIETIFPYNELKTRILAWTAFIGSALAFWVCLAIMVTRHRYDSYYRRIMYYYAISALRRSFSNVIRSTSSCLDACSTNDRHTCQYFAFWDNLFGVFEIEMLAHICIERFIDAWYSYKGWTVPRWHHRLFVVITTVLAYVYAYLPVIGVGRYCREFNCRRCTVDSSLPEGQLMQIVVLMMFFLRNYKPMLTMSLALYGTYYMYKKKKPSTSTFYRTRTVLLLAGTHIFCMSPLLLVKSEIMFYQYIGVDIDWLDLQKRYDISNFSDLLLTFTSVVIFIVADLVILKVIYLMVTFRCDYLEPGEHQKNKE